MSFPLNVEFEYSFKGEKVDKKFVNDHKELFPNNEDVLRYYQDALSKTLRNKKTIIYVSETSIMTVLNALESNFYYHPNDR